MTTTTAPPTVPVQKHTESAHRLRPYLIYTFFACMYILPFMRLFLVGTDEGTLDYGAVRVLHGQVFARDFFEVIGPGTFYWLAAFFKVFGVSFAATRSCLLVTSLGTAVLMFFLSRRICIRYSQLPCILLAATYFGGLWPATGHHVDSNFFALLAIACMVLWQDRRNNSLLYASGLLAGVATTFLQPKGILLFCAFIVWLWILTRRRITRLSSLWIVAAGYFCFIAMVMLYFWSKGALGDLLYVNVVWPSKHYETVNSVVYAQSILSNFWDHWVITGPGYRWTYVTAVVMIVPLLFIAALPGLLLFLGARCRWNVTRPEVLLYWLCGMALWLAELHRKDMTHLIYGSPLLIILCVHFLAEYPGKIAKWSVQILYISSVCLATFNLLCVLLGAHAVQTRVGSMEMFKKEPVLAFLEQHVAPGEEIFAYPYCPRYYFLSSTTNPTPYSILIYNYNTPSQFQEVVRILEEHKVKYVIWDKNLEQVTSAVFPRSTQLPPGGFIVEPYLESHYKIVQVVDGFRIMERLR